MPGIRQSLQHCFASCPNSISFFYLPWNCLMFMNVKFVFYRHHIIQSFEKFHSVNVSLWIGEFNLLYFKLALIRRSLHLPLVFYMSCHFDSLFSHDKSFLVNWHFSVPFLVVLSFHFECWVIFVVVYWNFPWHLNLFHVIFLEIHMHKTQMTSFSSLLNLLDYELCK